MPRDPAPEGLQVSLTLHGRRGSPRQPDSGAGAQEGQGGQGKEDEARAAARGHKAVRRDSRRPRRAGR